VRLGVGEPLVITVKVPRTPTVKVVPFPLRMAAPWFTTSVKFCTAAVPTPLLAVIASGYPFAVPGAGVPLRVAVPSPLSTNVTPVGNAPVSVRDGVGVPIVVMEKNPTDPTVKVVVLPEVIAAVEFTLNVNACVVDEPTPFVAVMVIG